MYIIHFYGSGFTTLIRFNYWILCETVLLGQGGVPRLAEVDFTDTGTDGENTQDLLYLAITSIKICSSIVNFFQNVVQYWYTSNVIQL